MQLCFFEDDKFKNFHPLTLTRPIDDLRIGILTIAEKWTHVLNTDNHARILRSELEGVFKSGDIETDKSCIWINARYLPTEPLVKEVQRLQVGTCLRADTTVIAARAEGKISSKWKTEQDPDFNNLLVVESNDFSSIEHPWDLFQLNGAEIKRDLALLSPTSLRSKNVYKNIAIENREEIFICENAIVEAGCVLDAREGPIYIGEGATIMAGSLIRGPVAICRGSTIKMGTKIYGDTTIGPVCKAGGEISNTLFHSYSNKAHDGYIGNSVIGQWCNFGAGTTVSNLKNNYSTIRITDWNTQKMQDSEQQFFGIMMGDHTKTAINSVINSGTICGVNCSLLSREFPPKLIASFSWVGSNVIQTYKLDKALKTNKKMMDRRGIEMTENYTRMMEYIFNNK